MGTKRWKMWGALLGSAFGFVITAGLRWGGIEASDTEVQGAVEKLLILFFAALGAERAPANTA